VKGKRQNCPCASNEGTQREPRYRATHY